jgi:hypothetical protein
MGGGLMQLVAYGAQDIYLTGNPQITFFKVVYRRHTNFSMESIEQTFNSTTDFGKIVDCTISRNGDLVHNMYLQIKVPALDQTQNSSTYVNWVNGFGNAVVKSVVLEVGGQQIDKHYGEWMDIWSQLNVNVSQRVGFDKMVGNYNSSTGLKYSADAPRTLYVPLRFWFNRNPGLALPLIALQYHEVKVRVEFNSLLSMVNSDVSLSSVLDTSAANVAMSECSLWVDYIYLDTDERRRFAQVSHEYLIEQLQHTGSESISQNATTKRVDLSFNHPVKQLIWVIQDDTSYLTSSSNTSNQPLKYECTTVSSTTNRFDTFQSAKLQLNGHDRMTVRDSDYFRLIQNNQHSVSTPRKHIYQYSFALKPDEHQPSGTCNFSRIDSATLNLTLESTQTSSGSKTLKVYAVNYNVLRIMSGMGGLAYSN